MSNLFKLVCVTAALGMTLYCCYEFSKNEDVSTISRKKYNEDETSPYPQLTLLLDQYYSIESELIKSSGTIIDKNRFILFMLEKNGIPECLH
jgi:hypothetical protein